MSELSRQGSDHAVVADDDMDSESGGIGDVVDGDSVAMDTSGVSVADAGIRIDKR